MSSPYSHFRKTVQGSNFMTPRYVDSGWITYNKVSYEISTGKGMSGQDIFGVTLSGVVGTPTRKLSDVFQSLRDAEKYIRKIKDGQLTY